MTWSRAALAVQCSSCSMPIAKGAPVRWVTIVRQPWCATCAARTLDEGPPADLLEPPAATPATPPVTQAFERVGDIATRALPRTVRRAVRDGKRLAAGKDDD